MSTLTDPIIACDIDLRRIHAWDSSLGRVICVDCPVMTPLLNHMSAYRRQPVTLLVECGSPHTYDPRMFKKQRSWLIYNSMTIGSMAASLAIACPHVTMLVSPSSSWAKGYAEGPRHKLAGAKDIAGYTKKQNHDLRECQAMVAFYEMDPSKWVHLVDFQATL